MKRRLLSREGLSIAGISAVVVAAAVYLAMQLSSGAAGGSGGGDLMFVELADGRNTVERTYSQHLDRAPTSTPLSCLRVDSAAQTTICLKVAGVGPTYAAEISRGGDLVRSISLPGLPSRARVSQSGRIVAWTTFVSGDSYSLPGGFSTRTGVFDMQTGELVESLEAFDVQVNGQTVRAIDRNFWGVTVADDDRTFYATLGTGGHTWLMQGDLLTKTARSVHPNVECPSLSPDGKSIAFKKRAGRLGPWELSILDLATGEERRLPGTVGIDDQAEWLGPSRLAYAAVPVGGKLSSIFIVDADGSTPASIAVPDATSPSSLSSSDEVL